MCPAAAAEELVDPDPNFRIEKVETLSLEDLNFLCKIMIVRVLRLQSPA